MNHENYDIKDVAIYLRKSRGDEEIDLINHKIILTDICNKYNWKYTKYVEIVTSDSIDLRPKIQELLKDIEDNLFDAILVVDEDRLSRGDISDQATIKQSLFNTKTYLVTPTKFYDFSNYEDDFMHDITSLFARHEYNTINKRFQVGKKIGARRGNLTNGTPPFPYEYERYGDKYNKNGLVVNDQKLITYRFIIEEDLKNIPPNNIAWTLNKRDTLSPRNTKWNGNTIHRILVDETHLGKTISNKGKGDSHAKKKRNAVEYTRLPKNEWIIVDNCHQKVKTLTAHDKILSFIEQRKKSLTRLKARFYTFSSIIKCSKCDSVMSYIIKKHATGNNVEYLKPCWEIDSYGKKCNNRGVKIDKVEELLYENY